VILATGATVIASQAVISGAFSLAHQASHLGYLPRLRVIHTSEREYGQVYVPVINWFLMAAVLALVLTFQSSAKLAFAYGAAVTGTIITTTVLFFVVVRHRWLRPLWLVVAGAACFLVLELTFFASNLTKIGHGAWFPLLIGSILFTVMITWFRGNELVTAARKRAAGRLDALVDDLRSQDPPVARTSGTGVFMARAEDTAPLAMRVCVDHLHSLPQHSIVLWIEDLPTPRIKRADRLQIDEVGYGDDGIVFVRAKHGYAERYNVPALVRRIAKSSPEGALDTRDTSFYLSRVELRAGHRGGMRRWRKQLFLATALIGADPGDYFRMPRKRTITLGSEIEF
jgi:KUP system potassium uptake protein